MGGLAPGGVIVFTTGGTDAPGEVRDAAMGVPMYHSTLGVPDTLRAIYDAGCILRHFEFDQFPEGHVYIIAQRPNQALEPTAPGVTPAADAPVAPPGAVAHL